MPGSTGQTTSVVRVLMEQFVSHIVPSFYRTLIRLRPQALHHQWSTNGSRLTVHDDRTGSGAYVHTSVHVYTENVSEYSRL